ncbi:MAG: P1 family peptidase [Acidobacteriota bacterium]
MSSRESESEQGSLTDIDGLRVGHATDRRAWTGCTVILCEAGAVAGLDVRGGAAGLRDPFVCRPDHLVPAIHAILLCGGSAFGLDATAGVMGYLRDRKIGFDAGGIRVPIVPAAILFDLGFGSPCPPGPEMALEACRSATGKPVPEGNVGAGTGATVGKLRGIACAMKSGLGTAGVRDGDVRVAALSVVNAFGDAVDPDTGRILAGTRDSPTGHRLINTAEELKKGELPDRRTPANTTLSVVATNARLDRQAVNDLARHAQDALPLVIRPCQTRFDGDLSFFLSRGDKLATPEQIRRMAEEVVVTSLLRAVRTAESAGDLPSCRDLFTNKP